MEIKLITGATAFEAGINTIKQIDVQNLEMQNLVVVPDAFSMQAENLIFDTLKIKSTFNIEVVGISRLASKILRGANVPFKRISALEEVFCIYKACKACEKEFLYFKNCNVDLCRKILQVIKQFKACRILPDKIKSVGDELLDDKMHDLKLVYENYEAMLGEKLDLSRLLQFFVEKAENELNLSKINLFFVNFDSFTVEINDFICALATQVNSVCIGMAKPISPKNAYIYEDDIFKKTTVFAKQHGVCVRVENFPTTLKNESLDIVENVFSFDVQKKQDSNFFLNVQAKNASDEAEFVAKYIKYEIAKGANFKDFAIAVADEKYFLLLKEVFADFGICANVDDAVDLSQTILGRFILEIVKMAKLGMNLQSFLWLASHPLLEQNEAVLHDIAFFDVQEEAEFLQRFPQFESVLNFVKQLRCGQKVCDFCVVLQNLLAFVKQSHANLVQNLQDERLYKKQSENAQALELLQKVLEKLSELGGQEKTLLFDFENLLSFALKSVKVETVPSFIDAVFVGDATESYFEDVKTLFILGAAAGVLPKTKTDTALVDDADIAKLRLNFALEPEIRVLNRRSRLKLFELFQHAKQKLIVCVPAVVDLKPTEPAGFILDLQTLFGKNRTSTAAFEEFDVATFTSQQNLQRLLFYVGSKSNLLPAYCSLKQKQKLPKQFESTLFAILKEKIPAEEKQDFVSAKFLLPSKIISASKLETYFACPKKYLLSYAFNLVGKENILPNKRLFGNFIHALLKTFVEKFQESIGSVSNAKLDEFLKVFVPEIAEKIYDLKILKNRNFLNHLTKESKIVLKNVIKEQKNSDFRPIMLEKRVFFPLDDNFTLVGFVDRVDKCQNFFRILDYKTGRRFTVLTELFYGKKLQIFLYAKAIAQQTGLTLAGVYYFDCQTKYEKIAGNVSLFNGLTLKDKQVVECTDWRVTDGQKSDIIGMSAKKNPKPGEFEYKDGNAEENLQQHVEYALQVCKKAIEEMQQGFAQSKPFAGECARCQFACICRHKEIDGTRKAIKKGKVENE